MIASMLTLRDVAARWRVNIKTVRAAIDRGELRAFRPAPRVVRVPLAEVERYERRLIEQGRAVARGRDPDGRMA